MALEIFMKGFIVSLSLIVAIGAQNAYILKLGLLKQHVLKATLFCITIDSILIAAGVFGVGYFIEGNQTLINGIAIFPNSKNFSRSFLISSENNFFPNFDKSVGLKSGYLA